MCRCGNEKCTGFYLLHPKEKSEIPKLIEKELKEDANRKFNLIDSPGNLYVRFRELHVIGA